MKWTSRIGVLSGLVLLTVVSQSGVASAHPLGNFTVNRYDAVVVRADEVLVHHVVDLAEIPTLQATSSIDSDGDKSLSPIELQKYATVSCESAAQGIQLTVGGRDAEFRIDSATATPAQGQAGLSTLRLECALSSQDSIGPGDATLSFTDDAEAAEVGWREVTLAGDGVTLDHSSVPTDSVSNELTSYPQDLLASPLDIRSATATVTLGGPALVESGTTSTAGSSASQPTGFGSQLLSNATSSAVGPVGMAVALLIAVAVGAAHALAPGHGKSLVAFALAGRRQKGVRAAAMVGVTVTATHTASVLVLGLVVATTSRVVPASIYPWLGLTSGVFIVGLGVSLVLSALRRPSSHPQGTGHGHTHAGGHAHSHTHPHQPHAHPHTEPAHDHGAVTTLDHPVEASATIGPEASSERRGLLVSLGILGGLVPSPTAVVVLLATVAAGNAWFGVLLVLGFGVGMALTLATVALLVLKAQDRVLSRLTPNSHPRAAAVIGRLPIVTAVAVCAIGIALAFRSWPF